MKNGLIIGTIACMVAIILVGSVLAPVINTTTTTTIKVDNDGAVGLRMEKITTGNFTITFDEVDGEFTATNGSDAQIIDDVCIFYADNNVAVWLDDSSVRMVGVDADDKTFNAVLSDSAAITITKSSEGVNITDGTVDKTFPVPSWSFVPKSTGAYGFFLNETEVNTAGMDTLFVGSFAGVDCYNGINTYNLPIVLDKTVSDNILSGAKWVGPAAEPEELNPDDLHIIPLGPSINPVDPEPDAGIMSVPTPTYSVGDWGYDIISGNAAIVSYSGTGGELIVPSTVELNGVTYTVKQFGKDTWGANVFDNSSLVDDVSIVFPEGLTKIGQMAFSNVSKTTGPLVLPDSITVIGQNAFAGTGFTGPIVIPNNVTTIPNFIFNEALNFTGPIVIPESVTSIGQDMVYRNSNITTLILFCNDGVSINGQAFRNNQSLKTILNFGTATVTTTTGGMNADVVEDHISALGYLAPAEFNETVRDEGPMAAMFAVIPLIMVIAILMFAVGFTIYRRME